MFNTVHYTDIPDMSPGVLQCVAVYITMFNTVHYTDIPGRGLDAENYSLYQKNYTIKSVVFLI